MQVTLIQVVAQNLGAAVQASAIQGDTNSMPFSLSLVFDVTALTGTSLQVQLQMFDVASGKFINYGAAFAAVVAPGTATYIVGPTGIGAAAGGITATVNLPAPQLWRAIVTPVAATNASFTLSACTLPLNN
jgi:hypothetical protein